MRGELERGGQPKKPAYDAGLINEEKTNKRKEKQYDTETTNQNHRNGGHCGAVGTGGRAGIAVLYGGTNHHQPVGACN